MKIVAAIGSDAFVLVVAGDVPVTTADAARATRVRVYDRRLDHLSEELRVGSVRQANGYLDEPMVDEDEAARVVARVAEMLREEKR